MIGNGGVPMLLRTTRLIEVATGPATEKITSNVVCIRIPTFRILALTVYTARNVSFTRVKANLLFGI